MSICVSGIIYERMGWGFDIEIGEMSKSNMIKYCRDEWIVISAETMKSLRGKELRGKEKKMN